MRYGRLRRRDLCYGRFRYGLLCRGSLRYGLLCRGSLRYGFLCRRGFRYGYFRCGRFRHDRFRCRFRRCGRQRHRRDGGLGGFGGRLFRDERFFLVRVHRLRVLGNQLAFLVYGVPVRPAAILAAVSAVFCLALRVLKRIQAVFRLFVMRGRRFRFFALKALHMGHKIVVRLHGRALRVQNIALLIGGVPGGGLTVHAAVNAVFLAALAVFDGVNAVLAALVIGGHLFGLASGKARGEGAEILVGIDGLRVFGDRAVFIAGIPDVFAVGEIPVVIAVDAVELLALAAFDGVNAVFAALIEGGHVLRLLRAKLGCGDVRQVGRGLYGQRVHGDRAGFVARIPGVLAAILAAVNAVLRVAVLILEHEHARGFRGEIVRRSAVGAGGFETLVEGFIVLVRSHRLRVLGNGAVFVARIPGGSLAVLHAVGAVKLVAFAVFNGVNAVFLRLINLRDFGGLPDVIALNVCFEILFRGYRLRALGDRAGFIRGVKGGFRAVEASVNAVARFAVAAGEGIHAVIVAVRRGAVLLLGMAEALLVRFKVFFRGDGLRILGDSAGLVRGIERGFAAVDAAIGAVFGLPVAGDEGIHAVLVLRIAFRLVLRRGRHEAGDEVIVILLGGDGRFVHHDLAVFIGGEEVRAFAGHHAVGAVFFRSGGHAPQAVLALDGLVEERNLLGRFGSDESRHGRGIGAHALGQRIRIRHAQAEHIVHIAHDEGNDHFFCIERGKIIHGARFDAVIAARADAQHLLALLVHAQDGIQLLRVFNGFAAHLNRVTFAGLHVNRHRRPGIALLLGARAVFDGQRNERVALAGLGDGFGHQRVGKIEGEALRFIFGRKAALGAHLRLHVDARELPVHRHGRRLGRNGHVSVRKRAGREHAQAKRECDQDQSGRFSFSSAGVSHRSPSSDDKKPFSDMDIIQPNRPQRKEYLPVATNLLTRYT